jgi:hypothetical protein
MEQIIMTRPNGNRVPIAVRHTATSIKSATQTWNLNGDETINIIVESPFPQQYEIGDKITVFGRDYTLNRTPVMKKTGMHDFQYTLTFEGAQYDLLRVQYELSIETTGNTLQDVQAETLTGTLQTFMQVLVSNANRVFPGKWSLGVCPETEYKTIGFDGENCLAVLQTLCNEFSNDGKNEHVEFEIITSNCVNTINMKKVGTVLPYTFKFGRGGGLYELTRQNVTSSDIVTRLKVFGSSENISFRYRAKRLCLPGRTKHTSFIEDATLVAKYGVIEGQKVFEAIKPHYDGQITSIDSGNILKFTDTAFPFDLNEKSGGEYLYLIPNESPKIHFNTGNLAGYEFEVKEYNHSTHTFILKSFQDDRGDVFPNASSTAFQFAAGDKYKILGVIYPDSLTNAAELELQEAAETYYPQISQPRVQYSLSIEKNCLKKIVGGSDTVIVNAFVPGDYIHIVDPDIGVDKDIRIKGFTRDVLNPYQYTLTISDTTKTTSVQTTILQELGEIDRIININNLKDPARARANWRTSRQVLDMVFDAEGDYYSEKIKPLSIDTLMLSVGAKSMQFGLVNTVFQPNYLGNSNVIQWKGGVLTHYTINEEHAVSWVIADGSLTFTDSNAAYYVYAKCSRSAQTGTFLFTEQQIKVEDYANYYHFLIGVLSSVDPDIHARSMSLTYGFTTINGRFIKTGRVESADGLTYFDLDNGEIGGRIVFTRNGDEKTLAELGEESSETKDFINNTLPGILDDIQAQLDGQIEQFFEAYSDTVANLTNQIDGKIETWFQTSDPATAWTTDAIKAKHVGDMWFSNSTNLLKRYSSSYTWVEIHDKKAIDAYTNAAAAKDTADGKRRVFVVTPYPPYDIGDLWVNGQDLRRCATAKASGQSYNVNDWVVAVSYDNTKTTIDGGLVTSGTIQVAGDNQSILAGMTGNGTTAESIRFWAGASFENRATAPFRVMQDGSVVMTKATIEGVIKAITGSIGGFAINQGRIGGENSYSSGDGLSLTNNNIRFRRERSGTKVLAAMGDLNWIGYDNCLDIELTGDRYLMETAAFIKCEAGDDSLESWYRPRALDVRGNILNIGKTAMFSKGYAGQAYTDIITSWFVLTHKFHFTSCNSSSLAIDLPTKTQVDNATSNANVTFDLEIVCDRDMPNTIRVRSSTGAQIYNNDGGAHSYIDMAKGDILVLRYYNGGYMIIQHRN